MKYDDLTDEEKSLVNNGCGPANMPEWCKKLIFAWMFHAQCGHHDWGYTVGGTWKDRLRCDLKFGYAMLNDVVRNYYNALIQTAIAPLFFISVLLFGCIFFRFGKKFSKDEALEYVRNRHE